MILADTSVWIEHLRVSDELLSGFLEGGQVVMHPFVIGELALGNLRNPERLLEGLHCLPSVAVATIHEVLQFIEQNRMAGSGIGYVDAHLLAAVRLTPGVSFWTHDKVLHVAAHRLGLVFEA